MRRRLPAILAVLGLLAACTAAPRGRDAARQHNLLDVPRDPGAALAHALPATPEQWRIPAGHAHGIEGFADRTSVLPGQRVRIFVSTTAPRFRLRAFRMGWYGGAFGRLVWTSAPQRGHRQGAAVVVLSSTHTVDAPWSPTMTLDTTHWAAGDYLLRLDSSTGGEHYVPLTVRAPSARDRVVVVNAVTTWQAYNAWGCCSLYNGGDGLWSDRSRAVSFDRPYLAEAGAGDFIARELPLVAEAERLGLSLDYVTDIDLNSTPHVLDGARAVISLGHDEYWSVAMRAAVTRARDAGTNLAFLGANAIYRRIRLAASPLGPDRLEINYKDPHKDPLYGHDRAAVTGNWPEPPNPDPESSLIGAQYGCRLHGPAEPGVVVDPHAWLFAGVAVTNGERLPGLIGPEADAVQLGYPTPRPITVLLHSPTRTCPNDSPERADATYYVAHSGAGVFDAGTNNWTCAIYDTCGNVFGGRTIAVVRAVTGRLLLAFAGGPAGYRHPAVDNLTSIRRGLCPVRWCRLAG